MKNALRVINQSKIVRLFAALLCFTLFTNETILAIPQETSGDIEINSLRIFPEDRQANDSVFLIVDASLTSSGCGIDEYNVNISNTEIEVDASFWQGDALAICTFSDTLFLGLLDKGEYMLTFNLSDSLFFKIPSLSEEKCKADFTVIEPDCDPYVASDCSVGLTFFYDISSPDAISWHWSFGDGHFSEEQHPKHTYTYNGTYQVCLEIVTSDSCESKICKTIKINNASDTCIHKGTVYDYSDLDGCGYIIELDNGLKLEPVKFLNEIELRDSMRVKLSYIRVRMATTCMVGQTAIITCIEEINSVPCKANFSIVKDSLVNNPLTYQFINKSRGESLQYSWDFGNGTTSSEANPTHTYSDTGLYIVCLKIYNESGCEDQICKKVWAGEYTHPNCKAQFSYQYISCDSLPFDYCPGYFVQFTDQSFGEALLYIWDFGDGNVSYEQNPSHFYEKPGFFPVTLKIESATDFMYCSDQIVKLIRVGVNDTICNAYFRYKALTPYHYKFYDCSYGDGKSVTWDFGDGTSGMGKIVDHVYKNDGVYEVCMTLTTSDGCTSTYCETIIVGEPGSNDCKATFDYVYLPCECLNCACLHFTSNTTDDVVEWFWDFGDSTYSYEPDPYHTYFKLENRIYTVCLTIKTANGCKSRYCKKVPVFGGGYEVPWTPVIGGEENHIIIVPENIDAPELKYGDYLGLFFKDNNGDEVCGGMLEWKGDASTLTAWGNTVEIWMSIMKNGFDPGEIFKYKIWKHVTNRVIDIAEAKYETDEIITDSSAYRDDGISKIVALKSCDRQRIKLYRGWNLISLNVEPSDIKMKNIFGNIQNIIVKDATGTIKYFPHAGIYDGEWNTLEGYKIKVWKNTSFKVYGTSIDPQTSIPLHGGIYPDFLPYYYPFEYPIKFALSEITNDIRYVQSLEYLDGSGKVMALNYIPAYGINQIGNMKPGLAYKLSLVTTLKSFTYPYPFNKDEANTVAWCSTNRNTITNQMKASFEESNKNRILVIPENVIPLNPGEEINIYTADNFFAGSWLYNGEGSTAITLWDNPEMPDYTEFEISIVDSSRNEVGRYYINIEEDVNVDGTILVLKKGATSSTNLNTSNTVKVYPNPVNDYIRFTLPIEEDKGEVIFHVFDLSGRTVLEHNDELAGQTYELKVDNLNEGVYVLQIQTHLNMYKTKFIKGN